MGPCLLGLIRLMMRPLVLSALRGSETRRLRFGLGLLMRLRRRLCLSLPGGRGALRACRLRRIRRRGCLRVGEDFLLRRDGLGVFLYKGSAKLLRRT